MGGVATDPVRLVARFVSAGHDGRHDRVGFPGGARTTAPPAS